MTRKLTICVTYGNCHRLLWHQLALASCEFYAVPQTPYRGFSRPGPHWETEVPQTPWPGPPARDPPPLSNPGYAYDGYRPTTVLICAWTRLVLSLISIYPKALNHQSWKLSILFVKTKTTTLFLSSIRRETKTLVSMSTSLVEWIDRMWTRHSPVANRHCLIIVCLLQKFVDKLFLDVKFLSGLRCFGFVLTSVF